MVVIILSLIYYPMDIFTMGHINNIDFIISNFIIVKNLIKLSIYFYAYNHCFIPFKLLQKNKIPLIHPLPYFIHENFNLIQYLLLH